MSENRVETERKTVLTKPTCFTHSTSRPLLANVHPIQSNHPTTLLSPIVTKFIHFLIVLISIIPYHSSLFCANLRIPCSCSSLPKRSKRSTNARLSLLPHTLIAFSQSFVIPLVTRLAYTSATDSSILSPHQTPQRTPTVPRYIWAQ